MIRIVKAEFIKGATKSDSWPKTDTPEFAFFGRSNTGKSSLINMLVNRKSLVKTGSRPGMTRMVNFFKINDVFTLADLPGYGYAQRSAQENVAFDRMIADYVTTRNVLKTIFFLIDLRREPGDVEKESIEYFERLNVEVIIVGTKADKIGKNDIANARRKWGAFFNRSPELICISSSTKNTGREDLLRIISERL
jgi:GTP-binding protein